MNHWFWRTLWVLALAGALFVVGCSDDDDDDDTPPPRIVGVWDANDVTEDSLGIQQLTYYFYSNGSYRQLAQYSAQASRDEEGSWQLAGLDSITFTMEELDGVNVPDSSYTWRYDIVEGTTRAGDVLHLWYFVEPAQGPAYYLEAILPRTQ